METDVLPEVTGRNGNTHRLWLRMGIYCWISTIEFFSTLPFVKWTIIDLVPECPDSWRILNRVVKAFLVMAVQISIQGFHSNPRLAPPPIHSFFPPSSIASSAAMDSGQQAQPVSPVTAAPKPATTASSAAGTSSTTTASGGPTTGSSFDGRRMRSKTAIRRTVDYNSSVANWIQVGFRLLILHFYREVIFKSKVSLWFIEPPANGLGIWAIQNLSMQQIFKIDENKMDV